MPYPLKPQHPNKIFQKSSQSGAIINHLEEAAIASDIDSVHHSLGNSSWTIFQNEPAISQSKFKDVEKHGN